MWGNAGNLLTVAASDGHQHTSPSAVSISSPQSSSSASSDALHRLYRRALGVRAMTSRHRPRLPVRTT